jgi:HlyD family secretion protein
VLSTIAVFALLKAACDQENGRVVASGTVEATEITVSAEIGGQLESVSVDEGDTVSRGQEIAQLETRTLELERKRAVHAVEQAQAGLDLLRAGARQEDIAQAREALAQAKERLELARREEQRLGRLRETGSVTESRYDRALTEMRTAQARYQGQQAALQKLRSPARPQEIRRAQARVAEARVGLERAEQRIEDATIRAPRSGIVTKRMKDPGEVVGTGMPVVTVSDLSLVFLTVYVSEPNLHAVRLGEEVAVLVDGRRDEPLRGSVVYVSPQAEFTPSNVQTQEQRAKMVYPVKIRITNEAGVLKAGMPAEAVLEGTVP